MTGGFVRIAIGSDHAGVDLKTDIIGLIKELGHDCIDHGTDSSHSVDYPDFGEKVARSVAEGTVDRGILICGTGIGMSIVANKFSGIRAALCNELFSARMSRLHNDANVLVLGGRIVGRDLAKEIVRTWVITPFEYGRHMNRLKKITLIEDRTTRK
jgi:ribose 5-phosphate isomerase B